MRKITRAKIMISLSGDLLDAAINLPFDPVAYEDVLHRMRHTIPMLSVKSKFNAYFLVSYGITLAVIVFWTIYILCYPEKFGGI